MTKSSLARVRNAANRRQLILATGGRRVDLLLEGVAAEALSQLETQDSRSATEIISALIIRERARRIA